MVFENLRIKDVRAVLHYRANVKKWKASKRKDHIIGIQLSGSASHDFGYQKFVLSRNCIFFFNQNEDYNVEVVDAGESFSIHFTTYEEIETNSFCIPITNPNDVLSILRKAETSKRTDDTLSLFSLSYRLCAEFERLRKKNYYVKDERMFIAKNYIDVNFKDADCLSRAIAQSGISSRRFNDLFKINFDTTPNRYLTERKIEHAKLMLETKSLTIAEIAELCGFSDVYYFSKVFKQICGVSPSKWN